MSGLIPDLQLRGYGEVRAVRVEDRVLWVALY